MQVSSLNQSPLSTIPAEKPGTVPVSNAGEQPEAPVLEAPGTRTGNRPQTHVPAELSNHPVIKAAPPNLLADPTSVPAASNAANAVNNKTNPGPATRATNAPGAKHPVANNAVNAPRVNDETPPSEQLSLDGLMKAWGTADQDYDLTRDGTVDVSDLLAFVAQQSSADPNDPAAAQLTQEGFTKAWGTDNKQYDLTQDGTVDVRDLLSFLESLNPEARVALDPTLAAAATVDNSGIGAGGGSDDDGAPSTTIQKLLDAWGTNQAEFDVTEDGRVDVSDLLAVLAATPVAEPEPTVPEAVASVEPQQTVDAAPTVSAGIEPEAQNHLAEPGTVVPDAEPEDSVDGVLKHWGTTDARFDYDDDGIVDVDDLLAAIAARAERAGVTDPAAPGQGVNQQNQGIRGLVENVMARLNHAGFQQQPPVNLHELLGEAGIEGKDRGAVLRGIAQQYPHGLGVNFRA